MRLALGICLLSYPLGGCVEYRLGDEDSSAVLPVEVEERFVQAPWPSLDVLFVVDSTGSMAEEQQGFAAAAADFIDELEARELSYQVGVTTTDPVDDGALQGLPWIITAGAEDPAAALAAALQVGTSSSPPAAGLDGAARALEDGAGLNHGFRRDDAALHVVFVSDGDDQSGEVLGDDPVGGFVARMEAEAARTGRAARASAVVGESPSGCDGPHGTALPGTRYEAVAGATEGMVASICVADFGDVVDGIGELAVEWQTAFPLQATPALEAAEVVVDGARVLDGWSFDVAAPALVFEVAPPPDASIVVRYTLAGGAEG